MPIIAPTTAAAVATEAAAHTIPHVVAEPLELLIGVDAHAASRPFALVTPPLAHLPMPSDSPPRPTGLRRAIISIQRRTGDQTVLLVVDGTGSYGAVLTDQPAGGRAPGHGSPRHPCPYPSGRRQKTDDLDAAEIARATRGLTSSQLRRPDWPGSAPSCGS